MARVSRAFGPGGRSRGAFVRALAAAAALALVPRPAFARDAAPDPPAPALSISFRALAARFRLAVPAPLFLERALPERATAARDRNAPDWKRVLVALDRGSRLERIATSEPGTRSDVTVDSGARVGCRIGDVVPYARLDVRSFAALDGAIREAAAGGGAGPGAFFRALGVRLDLDARTILQLEASLGEPDLGGAGPRADSDDRSLGVAIRLAITF